MKTISRRSFVETALALGATAACGRSSATQTVSWQERRDFFPEGVASGDPESESVLLWTRHPAKNHIQAETLYVEVAADRSFSRIVASAQAPISEVSDWTCRVLAGGLKPAQVYWYRFTDAQGNGSRIGRTITAPTDKDARPIRFAFISCQNANQARKMHIDG